MAFCSNCGNKLEPGTLFCDNCGTKVENPEPAAPQNQPAPAQQPAAQPMAQSAAPAQYAPQPTAQPAAQPAAPVQPIAPAKKKTPVGLIIVIVIAALVLVGGIIIAAILLLPKLIGGSASGSADYYKFESMSEGGATYTAEDLPELGLDEHAIYVILNKDGTGTFCFEDAASITWNDGMITDSDGIQYAYTLKGKELTVTHDSLTIAFALSDETPPTPVINVYKDINTDPASWTSDVAKNWNGVWYGVFQVSYGTGKYESYIGSVYDTYTVIYSDNNGEAVYASYIEGSPDPYLAAIAKIEDTYFATGDGTLFDASIALGEDASVGFSKSMDDNYAMLYGSYTDYDGDELEFTIYMKPYGETWDDIIEEDYLPIPPGYDDYLYNVENGAEAPYSLEQLAGERPSMG